MMRFEMPRIKWWCLWGGLWPIPGLHTWASKGCSCRCNTMVFPCRSPSWRKARGSPSACWLYATGISTRHADEDAELNIMAPVPMAMLAPPCVCQSETWARDTFFFCNTGVCQQQVFHVSHRFLWQALFKLSATAPWALVPWRIMKIQNILDPYKLNQNHTCSGRSPTFGHRPASLSGITAAVHTSSTCSVCSSLFSSATQPRTILHTKEVESGTQQYSCAEDWCWA